jgi:hypothetical protein
MYQCSTIQQKCAILMFYDAKKQSTNITRWYNTFGIKWQINNVYCCTR